MYLLNGKSFVLTKNSDSSNNLNKNYLRDRHYLIIVMSAFIVSLRKENGEEYKNDTIYSIICSVHKVFTKPF
jgi:hypothetical protein